MRCRYWSSDVFSSDQIGLDNPLEIAPNPGWKKIVDYWLRGGPRPSAAEADQTLMRLAAHDIAFGNNIRHPDVIDAMFRLPHSDRAIAFVPHVLGKAPLTIVAVDYDMGPAGVAYHDRVDADYPIQIGRAW